MADYKELIDTLRRCVDSTNCKGCNLAKEHACRKTLSLSAADAIEKLQQTADFCSHGEWIVCGDGENVPYLCSHCGKTVPATLIEKYPHNYCPNCGARMADDTD